MQAVSGNLKYSKQIRTTINKFIKNIKKDYSTIALPLPVNSQKKAQNSNIHMGYEIFLQISGSCLFDFPVQKIALNREHIIIVPPGTPHQEKVLFREIKTFCNLVFIFMPECSTVHIAKVSAAENNLPKPVFMEKLPGPSSPFYFHSAKTLCELANNNATSAAQNLANAILGKVLFDLGAPTEKNIWAFDLDVPCGDPYKIELVKKYIAENIMSHDLSIGKLSALAEYSPNYLSHLFKKITKESIKQFINRKKMEASLLLLETTPYNISEIALKLGYQDPAYFTKLFKNKYGFKPAEQRRKKPSIE